jgi:hypothetical protein
MIAIVQAELRQRLFVARSNTPEAQRQTGSEFGGHVQAIATAQREFNASALHAFKGQLADSIKQLSEASRQAWIARPPKDACRRGAAQLSCYCRIGSVAVSCTASDADAASPTWRLGRSDT